MGQHSQHKNIMGNKIPAFVSIPEIFTKKLLHRTNYFHKNHYLNSKKFCIKCQSSNNYKEWLDSTLLAACLDAHDALDLVVAHEHKRATEGAQHVGAEALEHGAHALVLGDLDGAVQGALVQPLI